MNSLLLNDNVTRIGWIIVTLSWNSFNRFNQCSFHILNISHQIILFLLLFPILLSIRVKYIYGYVQHLEVVSISIEKGSFIIQDKVMAGHIRPEASNILQKSSRAYHERRHYYQHCVRKLDFINVRWHMVKQTTLTISLLVNKSFE